MNRYSEKYIKKGKNTKMAKEFKLSPPWITFYREIEALFAQDPDVHVNWNEETYTVQVLVTGNDKADAIAQLLPEAKVFGNVKVTVSVRTALLKETSKIDLIKTAFEGNAAFAFEQTVDGVFTNPIHYVVFKKEVVQFFNDALNDIYGNKTTLYEEIAKDVIGESEGICFCTDSENKALGTPLGEWP